MLRFSDAYSYEPVAGNGRLPDKRYRTDRNKEHFVLAFKAEVWCGIAPSIARASSDGEKATACMSGEFWCNLGVTSRICRCRTTREGTCEMLLSLRTDSAGASGRNSVRCIARLRCCLCCMRVTIAVGIKRQRQKTQTQHIDTKNKMKKIWFLLKKQKCRNSVLRGRSSCFAVVAIAYRERPV